MSYQLIENLQMKANAKVTVAQACRALEVSRSGYYAHQITKESISLGLGYAHKARTSKQPLQPVTSLTAAAD